MVQSRMGLSQKEKDKTNYELLGVRVGHRDAIQEICSSTFSPGILASASLDRKVKIWTDCQSDCLATYTGHSGAVNTVRLHSQVRQPTLLISLRTFLTNESPMSTSFAAFLIP